MRRFPRMGPRSFRWKAIMIAVAAMAWPVSSRADFEDLGPAARPWGMANAYSALALDHLAIFYNPAGLVGLTDFEVGTGYNRFWSGLSDQSNVGGGYLALATPLSALSGGFPGGVGVGYHSTYLAGAYGEQTLMLGYGVEISPGLAAGGMFKMLMASVTSDAYLAADPLFVKGFGTSAATVDLGVMVRSIPSWNFSFAIQNLLAPNLAFKGDDPVPMRLRAGVAYRMPGWDFTGDAMLEGGELTVAAGTEKRFSNRMYFVRGGLAWGARDYRILAMGGGANLRSVQFDYGFVLPLTGPTGAGFTHRVSMTIRFGDPKTESEQDFQSHHLVAKEVYDQQFAGLKQELAAANAEVERLHKERLEDRTTLDEAVQIVNLLSEKLDRLEREGQKVRVIERVVEKPVAPKEPVRPATYTVKDGDTLKSIAKEVYGDEEKWTELLKANQDKIRQGIVTPGQILTVPW